ncbi:MAG: hypothetical protein KDK05_11660 [Candidatus Competibacteraceae bacterium]|nr:hypothetical protein [Candidatus Competibacteraceae bacterium]
MRRIVVLLMVSGIALGWLYAGTLAWRSEQQQDTLPSRAALASTLLPVGEIALIQARNLLAQAQYSPELVERLLQQALRERPLYAPAWLDLAELAQRQGQLPEAVRYLEYARALWPQRSVFLWRLALLLIGIGQSKPALDTLAAYWLAVPQDGLQVIALARRLQAEKASWVEPLLASINTRASTPLTYYRQLLSIAQRLQDVELARMVWHRIPESTRQEHTVLLPYVDFLLNAERYDEAAAAWAVLIDATGDLYNGDFEQPLINGGLGWRYRERAGFRIQRDRREHYTGQYSVLIQFTGSENVNFSDLRQRIIIPGGQRYRLRGYWKAYDVSTRSGVYLELLSLHPTQRIAIASKPRYGTWPWEPFELLVDVPDDVRLLELRLRRRATNALDNKIAGKIWLDDLTFVSEVSAE